MRGNKFIAIGVFLLILQVLSIIGSCKADQGLGFSLSAYGLAYAIGRYGIGVAGIALICYGRHVNAKDEDDDLE